MKLSVLLLLYITLSSNTDCSCCPTSLKEAIDITDGVKDNNTIIFNHMTFTEHHYFNFKDRIYGCVCEIRTCLNKCCPAGKRVVNKKCRDFDGTPEITVHRGLKKSELNMSNYYLMQIKKCQGFSFKLVHEHIPYFIQENGHIHTPTEMGNFTDLTEYCFEGNDKLEMEVHMCVTSELEPEEDDMTITTFIGMIISMPFLLATFLVYAFLPDRNLPAKALMCYVLSLLFAYILLVTIQLDESHGNTTCKALAFFCYFFFMASFFWMNASCLDIFFTFSGIRGLLGERKRENRRFMYYSAYAWGMPVLMVAFAALFGQNQSTESVFYTGLGDGQCWFRNGWPTGIYFYFPIAILLIINIVLFGITTYKIKKVQHDTKMLKNVDSRKHKYDNNDKQRFNLYVKLLFAMGINWSMEVISWVILWKWTTVPDSVWILTDFCNAVYGVFIFFIFVFKRNIWMLLKKRYLQVTGRPQQAHTLTSTHRTTVSQVSSSEA